MFNLIDHAIDHPFFAILLIVGVMFFIVLLAAYMIGMITAPPEDGEIDKNIRARRAHKKERNKRKRRAVTNAVNMVNDGCLEPPRRNALNRF